MLENAKPLLMWQQNHT